jgi:hypothetical protein
VNGADESERHSPFVVPRSRWLARRAFVFLAVAAAIWSLVVVLTGGLALPLFSSRNPRNPIILTVLMLVAAWRAAPAGDRRRMIAVDLRWIAAGVRLAIHRVWVRWGAAMTWLDVRFPPRVATMLALGMAVAVVATSIKYSVFVAAGSDAYGYVSQAHLWATGTLRQPQPLMAELAGFLPREALAPLAYRPSPEGATIVPVTSPGLPMLMAVFELAGGAGAVFAVVPLLAAVTVWATWLLGRHVGNRWAGLTAAALLATSPAFLFQLTSSPMSDIPAAAFWALSLVMALRSGRWSALASGAAAGAAILIRANLAPIAIVPLATMFFGRSERWRNLRLFVVGVVPATSFIAAIYSYWYGSPLTSGYGSLEQLYSAANLGPNLTRYSRWLVESQTPVILGAAAAPLLVQQRFAALSLLAFACGVVACYVFYIPFDVWWYLRFLLPAYPALMALTAATIVWAARWLPPQLRALAVLMVVLVVADRTIGYAAARATFDSGGEQKYAITGRYVAAHLPSNAVIICEQHSGSIRYYSNRTTIRFGSVPSDHLDGAVAELHRIGYRPYLVVEDWEEDAFRHQFAGRRVLDSLAQKPEFELPLGHVRIYPLAR